MASCSITWAAEAAMRPSGWAMSLMKSITSNALFMVCSPLA